MISNNPHFIQGRQHFEAGNFIGAVEAYSMAIQSEENPSIYSERAVAFFYLGEKEKSLADMNHATYLEPENAYRYSSRAYIKDALGDLEGAIRDYEIAIRLDPDDSIALNNLGLLEEKLGYVQRAQKHFEEADSKAGLDELRARALLESQSVQDVEEEMIAPRLSFTQLMRSTFTTKSGFSEYVQFIRNGFRTS